MICLGKKGGRSLKGEGPRAFTSMGFHSKEAKYAFFSNACGKFSKTDHMIGHKTSLKKFKEIEIISTIFSDDQGLKLETNPKGKNPKHSKSWRLNSMLLNNEWVNN